MLVPQAENDELRLQEIEDRKKIQHLIGVSNPLQQEITYERGGLPSSVTIYPNRCARAAVSTDSYRPRRRHGR